MSRGIKCFWVLVAAQAVFLLGWAGYHEWVRQRAEVIVVKGRPVDPRDLLRGDYMTLNYEISTVKLPNDAKAGKDGPPAGADVWVLLEKKGNYFEVAQASLAPLDPRPGRVLARGTIAHDFRGRAGDTRVIYGIERYFVPEGKGTPAFKLMEIELSVSPEHRLYIRRVLLDGVAYP